ncbi:MAG: dTDP-4-dehydrorhamnose reductase [Chlamydiota bacterium]|nr:dTDP-4-dehydrorhamnose reductase [Chlamydiota bacterium]
MKSDKKILLIGACGMLGQDLIVVLQEHYKSVSGIDIQEIDISKKSDVQKVIPQLNPDILINCAAFTQVDQCETDIDMATSVNATALEYLSEVCKTNNTKLVHISTDYVFDGEKEGEYLETDITNPTSVYGKTKLAGEIAIQKRLDNYLIVRTSWLYGKGGANFVRTILKLYGEKERLSVVNDQKGRPTYTPHLAQTIIDVIEKEGRGIINIANSGVCTWYEFARMIIKKKGLDPEKIVPVNTSEFPRPAKRPKNSVLSLSRLENEFGIMMPDWENALEEYLKESFLSA